MCRGWPLTMTVVLPSLTLSATRRVGIELLALLIEVGDLQPRAVPHLAAVRRHLADQQPQQRRLARSVRTDQADAIAAQDALRVVADDRAPGKRLRHVAPLRTPASRSPARRPRRCRTVPACARYAARSARSAISARDASFVAGAARLDALAQPRLLLQQLLVEPLELARLGVERGVLLLQVARVAARPRRAAGRDRARRCAWRWR